MIFSNLKDFRREDIYLGSYFSQKLADVKQSLLFDTYNGYLKILNKLDTIFVTKIDKVGTVIVKAETYHNWVITDDANRNIVFIKFSVMPHKTRLVLHKIVLRDVDVKNLTGEEVYKHLGNENNLVSVYSKIFHFIRLEKRVNYSFLDFPLNLTDHSAPFSKMRIGKNITSRHVFEEGDTFISPAVFSRVAICKVVTKLYGKYAIISVMKDLNTRLISLTFYFPQIKREHTTFLFASNFSKKEELSHLNHLLKNKIDNMHNSFVAPARTSSPVMLPKRFNQSFYPQGKPKEINDYKDYLLVANNVLEEESKSSNTLGVFQFNRAQSKRMTNVLANNTNLSYTMGADMSYMDHTKMAQESYHPDNTTISKTVEEKFKTQVYWEILAKSIQVINRPRNIHLLSIGQWNNILKEIVFFKSVMISTHLFTFEVIAEYQRPDSIMKSFKVEMYQNLRGVYYFLKVRNVSRFYEKHEKMSFFKAADLLDIHYERESFINIQEVKRVAFLLSKKIYFGIKDHYNSFKSTPNNKIEGSVLKFIDSKQYTDFCLHSRICQLIDLKEIDRFEQLYKTCIIISPPVSLTILLSREKDFILFLLHSQLDREVIHYKQSMDEISTYIPLFHHLLSLNDKLNIGRRLLYTYKNRLIVQYTLHKYSHSRPDTVNGTRERRGTVFYRAKNNEKRTETLKLKVWQIPDISLLPETQNHQE